jgi:nucleoside-diphosphate-sugar epimerase
VEAFLTLGRAQNLRVRTFNVGGPEAHTVAAIGHMASQIAGCSEPVFRPFPEVRKSIDIGSYRTDDRRAREQLGWAPRVGLYDGLQRTLRFYETELEHYLPPGQTDPPCRMLEHGGSKRRLKYVQATD